MKEDKSMPVKFTINSTKRFVDSSAWGVLNDEELLLHQQAMVKDTTFEADFNQLFDFQEVAECLVTPAGIRILADRNPFGKGSKRAFCVKTSLGFGMARMFQILTDDYPDELRVQYDNIDSAMEWLGINERA